jgi:hypothetical protein
MAGEHPRRGRDRNHNPKDNRDKGRKGKALVTDVVPAKASDGDGSSDDPSDGPRASYLTTATPSVLLHTEIDAQHLGALPAG